MKRVWDRRLAPLVLVVLAVGIHGPAIVFHNVGLDDDWLWGDTSPLRHVDLHTLHDICCNFTVPVRHSLGGEYLPVRDLLTALDMAIWGHYEPGPHITQLLLFGLLVWGLGTLLVRWRFPRAVAWGGVMLWSLHPLGVQSISWISERKGLLAALFVVATGHAWARFRGGGRGFWLGVAAAAAICGAWSKAPAMFAPAVFAAWDLLVLPRDRRRWLAVGTVGVATLLAAVPVVLTASQAHVIDDTAGATGGVDVPRVVATVGSLGHYAQGTVLARTPSLSYPIQSVGPGALDLAAGVAAIALSVVLVLVRRRSDSYRLRLALLAWAWIWFVPFSHLIAPVHILVGDRYAWLWLVAPCVGAALAIERLAPTPRLAVLGVLVCALAIATVRAEAAWVSSLELFSRGCAANPRDPQMCDNLAEAFEEQGEPAAALEAARRGLAASPRQPYLQMRVAHLLWSGGDRAGALAAARIGAESGLSSAAWRYARLLDLAGEPQQALWWARRAAEFHPELAEYQSTLAQILVQLGRFAEAEARLRLAIAQPQHPVLDDLHLAEVLAAQHRYAEARAALEPVRRDPELAEAARRLDAQLAAAGK